jgi:hypothetical protein
MISKVFWQGFAPQPDKTGKSGVMYDSQHLREGRWIFRAGDVTYSEHRRLHGNELPDFRM